MREEGVEAFGGARRDAGGALTPDWAARLRRRVKTFDDIAFTFVTALVLSLLRHERARYSRENQAMEQG